MKISANRNKNSNPELASKRLKLASSIRNNLTPERDLFFLKDYIQWYYPDYKRRLKFSLN